MEIIRKCFEEQIIMKIKHNQNLSDAAKAVLRRNVRALTAIIRKSKKAKNQCFNFPSLRS